MQRIMIVVDPDQAATFESQPVLARGRRLARALGADLHLYLARYHPGLDRDRRDENESLREARELLMERTVQWLSQAVDLLDPGELRVTTTVEWDHPWHEAIVREVERVKPAMVLKDVRRHPKRGSIFFTDTDWFLIRRCPAPLYLVRGARREEAGPVLAALDPMHAHDKPASLDRKILSTAVMLSDALGAQMHVIHSYMPMSATLSSGLAAPVWVGPVDEVNENIEMAHRDALADVLGGTELDPAHVHLEMGPPARVLIDKAAALDAAVLVMGAVSRTALRRLFVGSTAERVFGEVDCDLLIVKPETLLQRLRSQPDA